MPQPVPVDGRGLVAARFAGAAEQGLANLGRDCRLRAGTGRNRSAATAGQQRAEARHRQAAQIKSTYACDESLRVTPHPGVRSVVHWHYFLKIELGNLDVAQVVFARLDLVLERAPGVGLAPLERGVLQVAGRFLPQAEFQFLAGRQVLDREVAVLVGHGRIRILAGHDLGAHPGMNVAADLHRHGFLGVNL